VTAADPVDVSSIAPVAVDPPPPFALTEKNSYTVPLAKEGVLFKLGEKNPAWRKRRFVLKSDMLFYYKKNEVIHHVGG
jgi:hypothetical protein